MTRSSGPTKLPTGLGAVATLGCILLVGCGTASNDDAATAEPALNATATEAVALDLSDVRFDVRRDPG